MSLFLLLSDLTESKSKQAFSCLRVACLFICLFLNLRLPDRNLLFSYMSDFWNRLSRQFASSSMRQSWTQDSALQSILIAFSLHSLHFQMCISLIWYVLLNPLDKFISFYIFLLIVKRTWLDESKPVWRWASEHLKAGKRQLLSWVYERWKRCSSQPVISVAK